MRVSLRDLKGVTQRGMLLRYAVMGDAAFALAELPDTGTRGTSLEEPCEMEHWGFVLNGEVSVRGGVARTFSAGTAFHIPAGGPPHHFHADGRAIIAGFAPLLEPVDESPDALRARDLEVTTQMPAPQALPALMTVSGPTRVVMRGGVELETAEMGRWLFTRTTFGPLSGYTSGWCDLTHWGIVLSGDVVLTHENDVEILTAGDVFHCPAGPPGHQFGVADQATIVDYTPLAEIQGQGRQEAWRMGHRLREVAATAPPEAGRPGAWLRRRGARVFEPALRA